MSLVNIRKQMHILLWGVWAFIIIFILGFTMLGMGGPNRSSSGPGSRDELFARIGGKDVPNNQFLGIVNQFQSFAQNAPMQQREDLPRYAYEQLLQQYATAAAAEANGVTVSDDDVNAEINRQVDKWVDEKLGTSVKGDDREVYRARRVAQYDPDAVRRELLAERFRDKLQKDVRPVEVKVAHILIKTDKRSDAAALQLARDLARRARAGEDFAKLAQQYSEDAGSKSAGGVVGWASANPPSKPTGKDGKPNPNDAQHFVPEFTAASLRLHPGQISDPVHSTFGYHVIKALEQRDYQPADADSQKDPKKRQQAIDSYKNQLASQIEQGAVSEQKSRLEATIEPHSAWLKGFLLEQKLGPSNPPADAKSTTPAEKANALKEAEKLKPVTDDYTQALKESDYALGAPLAYKLSQLYTNAGKWYDAAGDQPRAKAQYEAALGALGKWVQRSGEADLYIQQGDIQQKLGNKTDALASYQTAMERAKDAPSAQHALIDKFKALGRADLADQAAERERTQTAKQEELRKQQEAEFKKRMAAQQAAKKPVTTALPGGPIKVQTSKPNRVSVTPGAAAAGASQGGTPAGGAATTPKTGAGSAAGESAPAKP